MLLWCVSNNHASSSTNIYYVKHHRNCRTCAFKCPEPDVFFVFCSIKLVLTQIIAVSDQYWTLLFYWFCCCCCCCKCHSIQFILCWSSFFSSLSNITESFNALLTRNGTTNVYYIDFSVKYCHRHPNKYFVTFQLVACIVWSSTYTKKSGETINKLMALNESSLISNQWM